MIFAANFIRWATHWLANLPQSADTALDISKLGVKRQVQVAAHVSAQVVPNSEGRLLKFSEYSAFAGQVFQLPGGHAPPDEAKSGFLRAFFMKTHLIAQRLR